MKDGVLFALFLEGWGLFRNFSSPPSILTLQWRSLHKVRFSPGRTRGSPFVLGNGQHPQLNCWWRLNTRSSKYAGTYPQVCLLNRIDQINPKLSVNSWDIIPYYFETLTKFAPKWTLVSGLFPLLKYSAPNVSWGSVADALDLRNQTLSTSVRVAKEVTSLEP